MEEIRKVRRAVQDDQDTNKEDVTKQGYLEQTKTMKTFRFGVDPNLPPVTFADVSVANCDATSGESVKPVI